MKFCKSFALVSILIAVTGCSMVDDSVLPKTRNYFHTLYNAVIEDTGGGYVVVSRDNLWHSGEDFPELAQSYCDETATKAFWEDMWMENYRQYARYSCR